MAHSRFPICFWWTGENDDSRASCSRPSEGNILQGVGTLNRAAYAIHSAIHRARPDVVAACHAHTPWAKVRIRLNLRLRTIRYCTKECSIQSFTGQAWSTTGRLLDPLTQDSCSFFEDHAIDALYTGVVFGTEVRSFDSVCQVGYNCSVLGW